MKIRTTFRSGGLPALGAVAVAAAVLVLSACGSATPTAASSTSASPTPSTSALHAMLPAAIQASGVIKVASTFGYPPQQFYDTDNTTPIGISVDLANALGAELGVKFVFTNVAFPSILPGLAAGRFDLSIASMSATPARAKQALFVEYLNAGTNILVKAGNPKNIQSMADLCGLTAAAIQGSTYADKLATISKTDCVAQGKKAITIQTYADAPSTLQAIITGRADASIKDFSANAYAVKQSNGQLQTVGPLVPDVPYGIALAQNNLQLAKAIQAALNAAIQDGSYAQVLAKWGVSAGAVTTAKLDGADG